jgi:hypothetical protein
MRSAILVVAIFVAAVIAVAHAQEMRTCSSMGIKVFEVRLRYSIPTINLHRFHYVWAIDVVIFRNRHRRCFFPLRNSPPQERYFTKQTAYHFEKRYFSFDW